MERFQSSGFGKSIYKYHFAVLKCISHKKNSMSYSKCKTSIVVIDFIMTNVALLVFRNQCYNSM